MNVFDRIGNGWRITISSFKVLRKNKQLIVFPLLSGISIALLIASFCTALLVSVGWDSDKLDEYNAPIYYLGVFVFYVVNYFIVVFFNMALIHCTRMYFRGEEVTVRAGIQFSLSRIGAIFSWAIFAGTIGFLLKLIQENSGIVGKIISSILGIVWSVATFFVVPVIAYENTGPIDAVKRSTKLMRQKWGESLGATFSFGLIQFICLLIVGGGLYLAGSLIDPILGIVLGFAGGFLVFAVMSAAQTIFVSAVYHNIDSDLDKHFDQQMVDGLFEKKSKGWFGD